MDSSISPGRSVALGSLSLIALYWPIASAELGSLYLLMYRAKSSNSSNSFRSISGSLSSYPKEKNFFFIEGVYCPLSLKLNVFLKENPASWKNFFAPESGKSFESIEFSMALSFP